MMTKSTEKKYNKLRIQLTNIEQRITDVNNRFDGLERQAERLESKLKGRAKHLHRSSQVLRMMDLFMRRPDLSEILAAYVSKFIHLLLLHIEKEFPPKDDSTPMSCVHQLSHMEKNMREVKRERVRFCHQIGVSSEVYGVLTTVHDIFCDHFPSPTAPGLIAKTREEVKQLLEEIDFEVSDESVVNTLKQTVTAVFRLLNNMECNSLNSSNSSARTYSTSDAQSGSCSGDTLNIL